MIGIKDELTLEKLVKIVKSRNVVEDYGGYFEEKWEAHFKEI